MFFISGSSSLVDYISFIATENVVFFDLVDYISFIATENVVFLGWLPCVLTVCWTPCVLTVCPVISDGVPYYRRMPRGLHFEHTSLFFSF